MIKFTKQLTFLTLLLISLGSNAVTIHNSSETGHTLGPSSPDNFFENYTFSGSAIIDDIYLFDIVDNTPPSILATTTTSIQQLPAFGISDFKFALTDGTGRLLTNIWGRSGDTVTYSSVDGLAGMQVYGVHYKGTVNGTLGGLFTAVTTISPVTASPVPAPTAILLFGSAMFGLLGASRSRKHKI